MAVDHDQGINGSVSYMFDSEMDQHYPGIFAIDASTGRFTTRAKLDREVIAEYEIKLVARDQGPGQSAIVLHRHHRHARHRRNLPSSKPYQVIFRLFFTLF